MSEETLNTPAPGTQTDALQEQPSKPQDPVFRSDAEIKRDGEDIVRRAAEKVIAARDQKQKAEEKAKEAPADADKEAPGEKPKPDAKPEADEKAGEEKGKEQPEKTRERGADGKFAAKADQPEEGEKPKAAKASAYRDAPRRFDDVAKADWESVPESVRGAVHRSIQETEQGIAKYKAAAEAYEPLKQFDEMARKGGGSLQATLNDIVALEEAFARNPVEGLHRIAQRLGFDLKAVAQHIAGQTPEQLQERQLSMQMTDAQRLNQQLMQELANERQARAMQQRESEAVNEWNRFQVEHPDARALEAEMAQFLHKYPADEGIPLRERLSDAYAFAQVKSKGDHTAIPDERVETAVAQTQAPRTPNPAGQFSISGPSGGVATPSKQKLSREDAIRNAMRKHGLA